MTDHRIPGVNGGVCGLAPERVQPVHECAKRRKEEGLSAASFFAGIATVIFIAGWFGLVPGFLCCAAFVFGMGASRPGLE